MAPYQFQESGEFIVTIMTCTKAVSGCDGFDDLDVAIRGLHASDVWVTRLRSFLPAAALAKDLRLEAAPAQTQVDPAHKTELFSIDGWDPCTQTVKSTSTTPASNGSSSSSSDSGSGCACTTAREEPALPSWVLLGGSFAALGFVGARRRAMRARRPR